MISGTEIGRFKALAVLAASLVLFACGGGGGSSDNGGDDGGDGGDGGGDAPSGPALSGTITIESRTRVDSDTADDSRTGTAVENDPVALAQWLPETGTVGGYLSATAGVYPDDGLNGPVFSYNQDTIDSFRIRLNDGDRVVLQVFAASPVDPEVAMIISPPSVGDICGNDCFGPPPFSHQVSLPDGETVEHVVRIGAAGGGPFRYVLTVSAEGTQATSAAFPEPALVEDEAIVVMDTATAAAQGAGPLRSAAAGGPDYRPLAPGVWAVTRPQTAALRSQSVDRREDTVAWIRSLQQQPGVRLAEPNYRYRSLAVNPGNDSLYRLQWHYPLISLPVAWQSAPNGGQGVGVAVMDTGLFSSQPASYGNWHPDLAANVIGFSGEILDFVSGELDIDTEDNQQRDVNPADPGDGRSQASNFHGTHVAGIVAGVDNQQGIVGVAPKSTLYPVRVLGRDGSGSTADLVAALNWAATRSDVDVINLSLGGSAPSDTLRQAIDRAHNAGKLVVAAAGNEGTDQLTYPAAFERVVGVGAVDGAKVRASYSNIGGSVDLVAPGGDATRDANLDGDADLIISAWGDDSQGRFEPMYAGLQGTSMAAPHVSGVYALMKGAAQDQGLDVTPDDFFAMLASGELTDPLGNRTEYGAGLINAVKAVDAALAGATPVVLAAEPSSLQFSEARATQTLNLTVYPSGQPVTVQSVASVPGWLSLSPQLVVGQVPPETLQVSVDLDQLNQDTSYATELAFSYDAAGQQRELAVPITVRRVDPEDQRDAGRHYVLLVDPDDEVETQQAVVVVSNGQYQFEFADAAPGEYLLVAGTDIDNNGLICENGEACAEYPVIGLPEPVAIGEAPVSGVVMSTGFRRPTLSEMGLPRYGFKGYRVPRPAQTAIKHYQGGTP